MAKLSLLAASFALLFVICTASITITTVDVNEELHDRQSRDCRRQMQGQRLRECGQFLMECSQQREMGRAGMSCRQQLQQCCQELGRMDEECRCQAVRMTVQRQQGEMQGEEMQEMVQTAMNLPNMCRMGPGRCEMRAVWF
ncbi:Tryp_alpha_amyl domain-containing protein [Cephalotus follicularis]|uniref:Tryp_alpha_amyl domain-containing protein n=1 Tax=Cephalotus follicularis TaxID=3775 RepID=A0A1Q3C5V9_CEPFO|nr:Tryp_alpha_amyl domain-containing protein [Cephalotus follicularis]